MCVVEPARELAAFLSMDIGAPARTSSLHLRMAHLSGRVINHRNATFLARCAPSLHERQLR